jgi:catechol 2,3-dioxygenase-like lactoylglutathione lyase family enzyme
MKKKLSHFCIHVKDMDKAVNFYKDTLGFEVEYQTDEWSELKLNDKVSLALQRVSEPGSGIGFLVDNCEEATKILEEKGVEIITRCDRREADNFILTQFKDPDGDILWMTERIK